MSFLDKLKEKAKQKKLQSSNSNHSNESTSSITSTSSISSNANVFDTPPPNLSSSQPSVNPKSPQSVTASFSLLPHQEIAVKWMKDVETKETSN